MKIPNCSKSGSLCYTAYTRVNRANNLSLIICTIAAQLRLLLAVCYFWSAVYSSRRAKRTRNGGINRVTPIIWSPFNWTITRDCKRVRTTRFPRVIMTRLLPRQFAGKPGEPFRAIKLNPQRERQMGASSSRACLFVCLFASRDGAKRFESVLKILFQFLGKKPRQSTTLNARRKLSVASRRTVIWKLHFHGQKLIFRWNFLSLWNTRTLENSEVESIIHLRLIIGTNRERSQSQNSEHQSEANSFNY